MAWIETAVHVTYPAADALSVFLEGKNIKGIVLDTSQENKSPSCFSLKHETGSHKGEASLLWVRFYVPDQTDMVALEQEIRFFLDHLETEGVYCGPATMSEPRLVEEEDWAHAWKRFYKPVEVGKRLLIKPVWEKVVDSGGRLVIEMDPGMAFGTGTHATTRICLEALEDTVKRDHLVFDIGTGSGILSVAAVRLGAQSVWAVDVDPAAVTIAKENARINQVEDRVFVLQGEIEELSGQAEIIVANITADVIEKIVPEVKKRLKPGGHFIASGIISDRREKVEEALSRCGLAVTAYRRDGEWIGLVAAEEEKA